MSNKAHCLTVDRTGCSRSTISSFRRRTVPGSWTGPLRQEITLNLELADLLVKPSNKGGFIGLLPFAVVPIEDTGRPFKQGLLPCLDLAGMDFVPGGQLGHRFLALHRFQGHLGLE